VPKGAVYGAHWRTDWRAPIEGHEVLQAIVESGVAAEASRAQPSFSPRYGNKGRLAGRDSLG